MDNTTFLVEITDTLGNLENDVPRQVLTEICQFDDLVEQLSALHY